MQQPDSYSSAIAASLSRLGGQRFCTEDQPDSQRLEWLKEIIGREYANVDISPPGDMRLYNDMWIYPWQQGLRLSPIHSNAITLERLSAEPTDISQDCFFAVLLTAGQYKLEQGEREVFLQAGEMTLYDATQPHKITIPGPFSKILLSIPRSILSERISNPNRLTAVKVPTQKGIGALAVTMLQTTVAQLQQLDQPAFQALSDPLLDLFSLSLVELNGQYRHISRQRGLALQRVRRFIRDHLSDPGLNTRSISEGVGLSVRYINNLFKEDNTSLMRYLQQQRLERCRHCLANPLYQHLNITEIAMQSGFNNMAHFSRVFRQSFAQSPRAYRSAALFQQAKIEL